MGTPHLLLKKGETVSGAGGGWHEILPTSAKPQAGYGLVMAPPHLYREPTGTTARRAPWWASFCMASGPNLTSPTLFKNKLSRPSPPPKFTKMIIHQTLIGETIPAAALLPDVHLLHAGPAGHSRWPSGPVASRTQAENEAKCWSLRLASGQTQLWLPCQGLATSGATWHCPSLGLKTPAPFRQSQTEASGVGRWQRLLLPLGGARTSVAMCWAHVRCRWLGQ